MSKAQNHCHYQRADLRAVKTVIRAETKNKTKNENFKTLLIRKFVEFYNN